MTWLKSPLFGGMGFLIALVYAVFEFIGAPDSDPLSKPQLIGAAVVALVFGAQAFGALLARLRQYEAVFEPKGDVPSAVEIRRRLD